MNMAKRNTDDMAYLVRQGQEVVVEEDCRSRHAIILAKIYRSQSQKRRKSTHTFPTVLGIPESKGWECLFMNGIKEGDSQIIADVNNLLQFVGRHGMRVREREAFLMKQPSAASSLKKGSRVLSARVGRANMFHPPTPRRNHFARRQGRNMLDCFADVV